MILISEIMNCTICVKQSRIVLKIFHGSIYENLYFRGHYSARKIKKSCPRYEVDEFIERLPGGYALCCKREGSSISLGHTLLSFLRAYLSDPKILILDEATSSIDPESEKLIQKATENYSKQNFNYHCT